MTYQMFLCGLVLYLIIQLNPDLVGLLVTHKLSSGAGAAAHVLATLTPHGHGVNNTYIILNAFITFIMHSQSLLTHREKHIFTQPKEKHNHKKHRVALVVNTLIVYTMYIMSVLVQNCAHCPT